MKQVKSGIPGLDKILGGGILDGSIITVSGPTGSGRSTFALQFILESGAPGLYISIEESKKDLFFHMSGYKWDLQKEEEERRLIILDYPVYEVDQVLNQYSAIQEIIQTTGVKRVVIDSIMPIAVYFKTEDERKTGFLKLIENIRKWGVTTLIVAHDTKPGESGVLPHTSYGIEGFTDGWIHIYYEYDEKREERTRRVEVLKMKGTEHSTRRYPARISSDGFTIFADESPSSAPVSAPVKGEELKTAVKKIIKKPLQPAAAKKKLLGIRRKK